MKHNKYESPYTSSLSLLQKCVYYIVLYLLYAFSLLPLRVLFVFSDMLYVLLYKMVGYRKKLVRKNLRDCFPEKSEEELHGIEKKFYHYFCDYIFETIKLTSMSKDEMRKRVHYTGVNHIEEYIAGGRNVVLYIGHYCNWEWVTSIGLHVGKDVMGLQIYHILNNKVFNALMLTIRGRMGTSSVSMQLVLRKIIEIKRAGQKMVLGCISDQVPLSQATYHFCDLLNHKYTPVITGSETIAKKCDFSAVYFDISRPRRGYYNIDIVPMASRAKDYADYELTDMYFHLLEKSIRRNPEYWLWTHNRWKRGAKEFIDWVEKYGTASDEQVALAKKIKSEE